MRVQLVCEGGGMRGIYTSGVLDFFIEKNIKFLDTIGVSAGACNLLNYASGQLKRQARLYLDYSHSKEYISFSNLIKTGSLFGFEYVFKTLADKEIPFDYERFKSNNVNLFVGVTNIETGLSEYHKMVNVKEELDYMIASCSLPLISNIVKINGSKYLDGGIAEAIPIETSINMGFDKQVVILTRDIKYQKKQSSSRFIKKIKYKKYPKFVEIMDKRHNDYNKLVKKINKLSDDNKILLIRPSEIMKINRFENDYELLKHYYDLGYNDAKNKYNDLLEYIKNCDNVDKFN